MITGDGYGTSSTGLKIRWTWVTCRSFKSASICSLSDETSLAGSELAVSISDPWKGIPTITPLNSDSDFVKLNELKHY